MAKQAVEKTVSQGICHFCQEKVAKNKMTQHLKTCKARKASIAKEEGTPERLFQILVEGTHRPNYWMHLEVPAEATLGDLDSLLRALWVECCDHLSEFEIGKETYSSSPPFGDFELIGAPGADANALDGAEEDEEDEEDEELPSLNVVATQIAERISSELHADLQSVPLEEIEEKLLQLFGENLPPDMPPTLLPGLKPLVSFMAEALQQGRLAEEMEAMEGAMEEEEEGDEMDVALGEVLNVGDKFSYVYDFGSSTQLTLRVIAEREGIVPEDLSDGLEADEDEDEEDDEDEHEHSHDHDHDHDHEHEHEHEDDEYEDGVAIAIIARNEAPVILCQNCGKPATLIESGGHGFGDPAESSWCAECAQKNQDIEELLPIVNSPRVGVCGYTGDADTEEIWYEEDDEEDEEDNED